MSSPSEIYAYEFQNSEPNHYTRVPNIIDHLTFSDDEGKTCRLSVYAKELYRIIRMTTTDGDGKCWRSIENLAELMNCSKSSVIEAKKQLKMPMHQLDGTPLIQEVKKQKAKVVDGMVLNKSTYCTYTINDIWKWNNAFMRTLKYQKTEAHSLCESAGGAHSLCESATQGAHSPGDPNNNTLNKNPLFKEQQPATGVASACSQEKQKRLFPSESNEKIYEWLVKIGLEERTAYKTANSYSAQIIKEASDFMTQQLQKNKAKGIKTKNIPAYFMTILQNRYWEKR